MTRCAIKVKDETFVVRHDASRETEKELDRLAIRPVFSGRWELIVRAHTNTEPAQRKEEDDDAEEAVD